MSDFVVCPSSAKKSHKQFIFKFVYKPLCIKMSTSSCRPILFHFFYFVSIIICASLRSEAARCWCCFPAAPKCTETKNFFHLPTREARVNNQQQLYSAIKHRSPVSNSNSICSLIFRVQRGESVKPSADVAEICSLRATLNRPQFNRYFKLSKLVFMF